MKNTTTRATIGAVAMFVALAAVVGLVFLGVGAARSAFSAPTAVAAAPTPTSVSAPAEAVAVTAPAPASVPAPVQAPAPVVPATPPDVAGIPCSIPAVGDGACVALGQKKAWLIRDGKAGAPVKITTGRKGYRTPTGSFSVEWKDADHVSKEFDAAPMPFSVFFTDGVAFHTGSLSQTSHGCIHLSNSTAKLFFSTLQEGDPVEVLS